MGHIATNETFLIDAPEISLKCSICLTESEHRIGWVGTCCSNCGNTYDIFEMTIPDIVKMQRELLKMSRKEISLLLGYKSSTVKRYELRRCSLVYYEKIKNLINLYNMGFIQFEPTRADYDSRSLPAYYLTADETILSKLYLKGDEYDVYLHNYDRLISLIKAGKITSKKPQK